MNLNQVGDELHWFRVRHFYSEIGVTTEGIKSGITVLLLIHTAWNQINLSVCTSLKDLAEIAEKPPDLHDTFKGTIPLSECRVELCSNSSTIPKYQFPLLHLIALCLFFMLKAIRDQVCPKIYFLPV